MRLPCRISPFRCQPAPRGLCKSQAHMLRSRHRSDQYGGINLTVDGYVGTHTYNADIHDFRDDHEHLNISMHQ